MKGRARAQPSEGKRWPGREGSAPQNLDLYLGNPMYQDVLGAELRQLRKDAEALEIAPGLLGLAPGVVVDPSFARQVLPQARRAQGPGPSALLNACFDVALEGGAGGEERVIVAGRCVVPDVARDKSHALAEHPLAATARLIDEQLQGKIEGRLQKRPPSATARRLSLQVVLDAGDSAWVSVSPHSDQPPLLSWPCAFAGGRALQEVAVDAPSSAHRKLEEAFLWLGDGPREGDVVLDLGAAPGGWSSVCLKRGASVIAVDRADLDPALLNNPALTHVRQDAFRYVPERQPQWLVCDVITDPERSLALCEAALQKATASSSVLRGAVVTLKLKRPVPLEVLSRARAIARSTPGFFGRVKNLVSNKLEVSMMMRRIEPR